MYSCFRDQCTKEAILASEDNFRPVAGNERLVHTKSGITGDESEKILPQCAASQTWKFI